MNILSRDTLPLGGFAGIVEHRLVTDSRVFGDRKKPETFEGFANMVYLADAKYKPHGASGMHPHSEIDVISIIIEGRVSHEGSMEHGKDLVAGDVQIQRAGGEGFSHNEINPDDTENRMLQVWALPEESGQPASYKSYTPEKEGVTRIYGGDKSQDNTFDSHTIMDIENKKAGQIIDLVGERLIYVITGDALIGEKVGDEKERDESVTQGKTTVRNVKEGDLILSQSAQITAKTDLQLLVVSKKVA